VVRTQDMAAVGDELFFLQVEIDVAVALIHGASPHTK
jgi:hypothetical protein